MTDWQERITRDTPPAIRIEHEARYRLAAPLIAEATTWCDLGCGNGIGAAAALGDVRPPRAVLVDLEPSAVEAATAELGIADTVGFTADLTVSGDLAKIREALGTGPAVVTCFEVVEHLANWTPLVDLLTDLAEEAGVTTVLSVPNDAFSGVENPHHLTVWGEGAFEELARLLPEGHVLARQVQLAGSGIALGAAASHAVDVALDPEGAVPTHFLAAFGPQAASLGGLAVAGQVDLDAHRAWERQRESDNELLQQALETVERQSGEFADWRAYIHELEDRLGLPRTGTPEREAYDAAQLNA